MLVISLTVKILLLVLLFSLGTAAQSVTGVVMDTRGDAIAGAEVILESDGVLERTATGDDGTFSFALAVGRLSVSAPGFERQTVQLKRERTEPLTIVLQPSPVTGNVNVTVTRTETDQTNASIAVITIESLGGNSRADGGRHDSSDLWLSAI